ncbi:LLM class flavin-dependent oxidoreductase [Microbacterium sp.]|uniref:LLM class flavin-dependent oxidoreductase n=1 Tax=Microbacterium sp. TaxID=51671 RepID=UPI003340E2C9
MSAVAAERLSLLAPFDPVDARALAPFAELVRGSSLAALWQGQSLRGEPLVNAGHLSGRGYAIPYSFGVLVTALHHPYAVATALSSIRATTREPVVAGFGPGGRAAQIALTGAPIASPLEHMRGYLTSVREHLTAAGTEGVSLGLGVLRPRMARLAGEVADVAVCWLAPPRYLAETIVPELAQGAEDSGRARPRVVAYLAAGLGVPPAAAGDHLAVAVGAHLSLPHYRDALGRAGVDVEAALRSPEAAVDVLTSAGVYVAGGVEEVRAACARLFRAGADEVVLNLTGVTERVGIVPVIDLLLALDEAHVATSSAPPLRRQESATERSVPVSGTDETGLAVLAGRRSPQREGENHVRI